MGATDSKLAFRKGVFKLFEERNIPASDEYWSQFWLLPESADDVFSLVGASDIRRVRDHARENLETLINKVIERLFRIVKAPDFPSPQNSTFQLLNYQGENVTVRNITGDNDNSNDSGNVNVNRKKTQETGTEVKETEPQLQSPLGERLLSMIIDLLFLSGFTIPTNIATETRVNYVIWETGVGSTIPIGSTKEYDLNKTETLRLLLVLVSKSMYLSGGKFMAKESKCLKFLVLKTERKVVLALLCSLLNTAVKYNPAGWGVPYNYMVFADAREVLVTLCLQVLLVLLDYRAPANRVNTDSAITASSEPASRRGSSIDATINSNETLSVNYHPSSPSSSSPLATPTFPTSRTTRNSHSQDEVASVANGNSNVPKGHLPATSDNAFRYYTSKLHRTQDFQFLMDGIYRILSNPMQANNTYLPGSSKPIRCHPETLMLCWKLLEINKRFRAYLLETDRVLDVLIVILYYALENKQDPAQNGLVRMCAFILQTISADRNFGVKLNKVFEGHSSLPSNVRIPAFHGTYADFMIISIYALISTTRGALHSLYPALVLTITNVSPYLKNLSVVTSTKLVQLFVSFSTPGFLLSEEGNHFLTGYMLEAFNNIIQYQFSDNPHVIYAIVRTHKKFEDLSEFTLAKGLLEIRRIQAAKEERRKQARGSTKSAVEPDLKTPPSSTPSPTSQDAGTIKPSSRSDNTNIRHHGSNTTHHDDEHDEFNEKAELLHSSIHSDDSHSEKARGKLPEGVSPAERRQSGDSSRSHNIIVAPFAVGKSGFVPTEDWVSLWHSNLPLNTMLILLSELVPQVQSLCGAQSHSSEQEVLEFLRSVTLVGILPQPQPVSPHHFLWSEASVVWFSSLLWGQIYLAGSNLGVFNGTQVKLFLIKTTIKEDRIKNALGTAVGGVQGVIDRFTTATTTTTTASAATDSA
ncbi:1865_t:CDS:10 [Ambispora gerdemannii]|uniref:1865_t:CDS:1 n=1 Tax=Ambispora gerdemannii TaxID=144530 RepID=A0A9N9F4H6_9GLOM|nr:1865_t:CDS:10 [Ambispora gerdemannii]